MFFPENPETGTAISKKRKCGPTKRVGWDNNVKADPQVVKGWVTLSHVNGRSFIICNICGKGVTVRMRREFDPYNWSNQSSGHKYTKSHISAVASKVHYDYQQAKAFAAASENGEVYVPPKPKKQRFITFSVSRTVTARQGTAPSANALSRSNSASTQRLSAPENHPNIARDSQHNIPNEALVVVDVDAAVDSTRSNSRSCQGIIPSCKGRSPALLLLFKYGRLNPAADYSILQVANSDQCNLFSKTCSGRMRV